ncbi:MAG: hypothetical protein DMF72_20080 [Acidobacteria bacterium]|nr:MAG: hypothetical protein DMF72_20080 [Acidobacteriota bacterium]
MSSRRRVNSDVMSLRSLKRKTHQRETCRSRTARGSQRLIKLSVASSPRLRILAGDQNTEAPYNLGRDNKSLDASGIIELLIDK